MLQLTAIGKRFGGRQVLAGVSLALAPGEYAAIVGDSGVGKSTLLNVIAGLEPPDEGEVRFEGAALGALDDDARTILRREKFGFVFQAFHVLPHLTLEQNVGLPLLLRHRPQGEIAAKAREFTARSTSTGGWGSGIAPARSRSASARGVGQNARPEKPRALPRGVEPSITRSEGPSHSAASRAIGASIARSTRRLGV